MEGSRVNNALRLSVFDYVQTAIDSSVSCSTGKLYTPYQQARCLIEQSGGYPSYSFCDVSTEVNDVEFSCDSEFEDQCSTAAEIDPSDSWPYNVRVEVGIDLDELLETDPCFERTTWTFSRPEWKVPYCSSAANFAPSLMVAALFWVFFFRNF
jgi:hypothetical protein